MSDSLVPCASCARHLRCTEVHCPFCGVVRLTTGALIALSASLAIDAASPSTAVALDEREAPADLSRADLPYGTTPRPMMVQYGAPPPPPPEPEPPPEGGPKPPDESGPIRRNGAA